MFICYLIVRFRRCCVVQRNTVTEQLLTTPRYDEYCGSSPQIRYNEVFDKANQYPQSLSASRLNRGSTAS